MILAEKQKDLKAHKLKLSIEKECEAENLATQQIDTNIFTIVSKSQNKLIGVIGFSDKWWCVPTSSQTGISIKTKSYSEAIAALVALNQDVWIYKVTVDGSEWNIYREEHEFCSDDEAIAFGRQLADKWLEAKEVRIRKKLSPGRWIDIL